MINYLSNFCTELMWNQQEVRGNFSCDLWNVTLWLNYASSRNVVHDECHQSVINLNSNFMSLGNAILTRHKVKQWMGTLTKRRKTTTKVCYDPPKSFTLRPASFFHHQSKLEFVTRSRESRTCFWVEERLEVKGELIEREKIIQRRKTEKCQVPKLLMNQNSQDERNFL